MTILTINVANLPGEIYTFVKTSQKLIITAKENYIPLTYLDNTIEMI